MKKILLYSVALVALLATSCSKSDVCLPDGVEGGMGAVSFTLSTDTRTGEYDPMDYYTIRIYSADGLIRKYTPEQPMPEVLSLLAGSYSIDVELGDKSIASWSNKSYRGEADFVIKGGEQTRVEVLCKVLNATVTVKYDASVAENLQAGFKTTATLYGEQLVYTDNQTGYFLPDGQEAELEWSFAGEHAEKGAIAQSGKQTIKAGGKYTLHFKFSPDAEGMLDFDLEIVEPTVVDDVISFSPEPVFKGEGFDLSTTQKFYNTTKTILLSSPNALTKLTVEAAGQTIDLTNSEFVTKTDEKNWKIQLTDDFFSPFAGGENAYLFSAEDADGGRGKATANFLTQGIVAATEADCDLWLNTADVKVKIFDASVSSVQVKMRRAGGPWVTYPATKLDNETFVAKVEPKWVATTNEVGGVAYQLDVNSGVLANTAYEAKAVIGGVEKEAVAAFTVAVDQTIPYGDFEDSTLSCFSIANQETTFWGSGNNNYMNISKLKNLCTQQQFAGQGGSYCARMHSESAAGILAAGNLFSGTFVKPSTQGTVAFGKPYEWKARPTALRFKYYASKIGSVNMTKYKDASGNDPIAKGSQDKARIYVAIIDWSALHEVSSGLSTPTGMWDPAAQTSVAEGAIIGYASFWINATSTGDKMITVDVPFYYYDKVTKPSKSYAIAVSCSANAYGDYMCGCDSNEVYVDDFEWVY